MAFPGRLHEKGKRSIKLYIIVTVILTMIGYGIWEVRRSIRTPLTPKEKKEISATEMSWSPTGRKRVDKFSSDVNQILHGDPLKRAQVKTENKSAVVYATPPAAAQKVLENIPANYYSDRR